MALWKKDKNYGYGGALMPGFLTPPATWNSSTRHFPPMLPRSERKPTSFDPSFHVIHKIPAIDSPYARAKHVQLVDKDPYRAIPMFWAALNAGDRVDSSLKDMASLMKQVNRSDEAIEAIKSFRYLCPPDSQDSLDNLLLELYKKSGRMEEHIDLLQAKVKQIEGLLLGGRKMKTCRHHGKKYQVPINHEYSRLLGNLAYVYLQHDKYSLAEEIYRKALLVEQDRNKLCNLAICLMYLNKITEAKFLLECARSSANGSMEETHAKSFKRASQILAELESHSCEETRRPFSSFIGRATEENVNEDQNSGVVVSKKLADSKHPETSEMDEPMGVLCSWNDSIISGLNIESSKSASLGPGIGYDSYMIGYSNPVGGSPRVPFTQPRKGPYYSSDDATGKCSRKLLFAGTGEQGANSGLGQASGVVECAGERKKFSSDSSNKGWATMGAEEDAQLPNNKFTDENTNYNIFIESPVLLNQKMGSLALEDGYDSQSSNANTSANVEVWQLPWIFENMK